MMQLACRLAPPETINDMHRLKVLLSSRKRSFERLTVYFPVRRGELSELVLAKRLVAPEFALEHSRQLFLGVSSNFHRQGQTR